MHFLYVPFPNMSYSIYKILEEAENVQLLVQA